MNGLNKKWQEKGLYFQHNLFNPGKNNDQNLEQFGLSSSKACLSKLTFFSFYLCFPGISPNKIAFIQSRDSFDWFTFQRSENCR